MPLGLKAQLIREGKPVVCMLDGDSAGYAGSSQIHKQLRPFLKVGDFCIDKLDPKDMNCKAIIEGIENELVRIL